MSDFTFLTVEQIFGNAQLDIIKNYDTKCATTDFSILLGGYVTDYYTKDGNSRKDRTGWCGQNHLMDIKIRASSTRRIVAFGTMFTNAMVGLAQLYLTHQ